MKNEMIYSRVDSERFGLSIYRCKPQNIDEKRLKREIFDDRPDVVFLRLDVSQKSMHHKIYDLPFEVIHADTLNYYSVDLNKYEPKSLRNDLRFDLITETSQSSLETLIPIIFDDYQNHYFSNKHLNKAEIIQGYTEWAKSYVIQEDGKISWYVYRDQTLIGFATCSFDEKTKSCEGVLYGILPDHSGGGVYTDIIRYTQKYFKERGFREMKVSTQVQNFAVQKVWTREGFYLREAYDTYHINSFLSNGLFGSKEMTYRVSLDDISSFGNFSGDKNKIHFDDEYAKSFGFKSRIAHGMIYEAKLSHILGNVYPGQGTIIMSQQTVFTGPIFPDKDYQWVLRSFEKRSNGFEKICSTVEGDDGKIKILSYSSVIRRS
jgi:acyl dehydratase/GNAT superfamily N-acetyltransferase